MNSGKKFAYSVIILLVVLAAVFGTNKLLSSPEKTDSTKDFPEIKNEGILRIVTDYNNVGYYVSGDSVEGFNHDMLKSLESYSGLKFETSVENNLEKCLEGLNDGTYDVIARNIPVNNSLQHKIAFTQSLVRNKLVLVQRKPTEDGNNELVRSHLTLARKTVYVPCSSPAMLRLQNLSHEIGDTIYIREDSLYGATELIIKVASGEIDFAVTDEKTALRVSEKLPEIDIETAIGFTHFEAWAVRNTSVILLDSLNSWIDRFEQTGEYQRIYNKYYGK